MRFRLGGPPVDEGFKPDEEGWTSVPATSTKLLVSLIAVSVVAALVVVDLAFQAIAPPELHGAEVWHVLLAIPLVIAVHELVHAMMHPRAGITARTVMGFWPAHVLPYVVYQGSLARNRLLMVLLAPFLLLTLLPLIAAAATGWPTHWFWLVALLNATLSSGDLVNSIALVRGFESDIELRGQGTTTYWRRRGA